MSLPEAVRTARTRFETLTRRGASAPGLGVALCLALGLSLTACQVRPLYGTAPSVGALDQSDTVQTHLAAVEIDSISSSNGVDKDARRELYNELTFLFERGAGTPDKRYRLEILMDQATAEVGVEQLADVPAAYTMTVNTSFVLVDKETDTTLMTGKSFATASYDFSNQRFANIRAKRDAGQRAARVVAADIQARVAGYFATR